MPAIWSLIGDAYYEEAKAYVFNQPGDAETYAELIAAIDRYHYGVQAHSRMKAKTKRRVPVSCFTAAKLHQKKRITPCLP